MNEAHHRASIEKASTAVDEHKMLKIDLDGRGTMTRGEFVTYYVEHRADK